MGKGYRLKGSCGFESEYFVGIGMLMPTVQQECLVCKERMHQVRIGKDDIIRPKCGKEILTEEGFICWD